MWVSDSDFFSEKADVDEHKELPSGYYECEISNGKVYFHSVSPKFSELVKFPRDISEEVIKDIESFWANELKYRKSNILFKRGIILYGPPGSGKTSVINIICHDVIARGGIIINFINQSTFNAGIKLLRRLEPNKKVVVLMEDIDSIIKQNGESNVLNILDGVNQTDNIVFLATTNYPEQLGARIINRPSRFDKRFKIGYPNKECREIYLKHLITKFPELTCEHLDRWIEDTRGFSVAHILELFKAVNFSGDNYDAALACLKEMKEYIPSSEDDEDNRGNFGFYQTKD